MLMEDALDFHFSNSAKFSILLQFRIFVISPNYIWIRTFTFKSSLPFFSCTIFFKLLIIRII